MSIITVRKTRLAEAIQIHSSADEERVRAWLSESYGDPEAGKTAQLDALKDAHYYFMRDEGSNIVFLVHPANFLSDYEEVSEQELEADKDSFKF